MATELICPDCGGIIGGDDNDARPKCQCASELTLDDTEVEPLPLAPAAEATPAPKPKKICWKCGKDVTHAKRAKDDKGYWCYDCHKADKEASRDGPDKAKARCPECGRLVPAESILNYHGSPLCVKCRMEQDELPNHLKVKYKRKPGEEKEKQEKQVAVEKRWIMVLGAVIGVLAIIVIIAHFR